jgi:AraC-like DNA-binding protein
MVAIGIGGVAFGRSRGAEPFVHRLFSAPPRSSRSALAERFTSYVEVSPMQYFAHWRLQLAARLLDNKSVSIAKAAAEVGYESEAAFSRAFKKYARECPKAIRRRFSSTVFSVGAG